MPNPDAWAMKKALTQARLRLTEGYGFFVVEEGLYWASCQAKEEAPEGKKIWDADPKRARYLAVAGALDAPICKHPADRHIRVPNIDDPSSGALYCGVCGGSPIGGFSTVRRSVTPY